MNILQINNYSHRKGGSEAHFLDLIELLEGKGHQVIAFSADSNKKCFLNFKAAQRLELLLKENKIDVAHIHNINHLLSPLILKVLKKNKIPIVMTVHDYSLISPNYNLYLNHKLSLKNILLSIEFYLRKLLFSYTKLVDVFIAPSKFMETKLKEKGFKNVKMIHNFIQHHFYDFKNQKETNNKNGAGFTKYIDNSPKIGNYFLFFGRLSKEKGLEDFIKTLKKVKKDFLFQIVGIGPEKNNLTKLVNKLDLNEKIRFLGYKNRETELSQIIDQAQFVVIPSLCQENCSLSILESMAHGKAVLAPRLGGNSEIINNQTGFLYEVNDERKLLDKIGFLIDNRESIWKEEKIKKDVQIRFNSDNYYQKLIKVYNKLI